MFLFIFTAIIFFAPEMGGYFLEANNFIPADPLKTPPHIAPVWYFTPFYSMLRATTDPFKIVLMIVDRAARRAGAGARARQVAAGLAGARGRWWWWSWPFTEAKFWGVVVMGGAVIILFFLPWLDRSPGQVDPLPAAGHKVFYGIFVFAFLMLGYLGTQPPSPAATLIAQIGTLIYFAFFLGMPLWSALGTFKPPPERVPFKPH